MDRMKRFPIVLMLALATLAPSKASAQAEQQCVDAFLAACATLHYVNFTNDGPSGRGQLSLLVSNTSNGAVELNAYIRQLIFDITGVLPAVQGMANAQYGFVNNGVFTATNGDQENWNAKTTQKTPGGAPDEFQLDLSVKDDVKDDQGGNKDRVAGVGEGVLITVDFAEAFLGDVTLACTDPNDACQGWSAEMKGMGDDGKGKGFTTPITANPEPGTIILLASGLLGIAGVGAVRRRREREDALSE